MKIKPEKIKESSFRKAIDKLPKLLLSYQASDYFCLGEMCNHLCVIDEFIGRSTRKLKINNDYHVNLYRNQVYSKMYALVLASNSGAQTYTRRDLIKFLRGEFLHGDSDNRDMRRRILHDFVFENDESISLEFGITWSFVIYPGLRSTAGNTDSRTPFLQRITFDKREIVVTQVESIVINALHEYLSMLFHGKIPWNKVAFRNDIHAFRALLGGKVVDQMFLEEETILKWLKDKEMTFEQKDQGS